MKRLLAMVLILLFSSPCLSFIQAQGSVSWTRIAWTIPNQIILWDESIDESRVLFDYDDSISIRRINLSPDGSLLAVLIRSVDESGRLQPDEQLAVIETDLNSDNPIRTIFTANDLYPNFQGFNLVNQFEWADNQTLIFDTKRGSENSPYTNPSWDLWRVNIITNEVVNLLPLGEGGNFSISPNGNRVVAVNPGYYDDGADGFITIVEPDTQPRRIFRFPAIANNSEWAFYPTVEWLDAQTLWSAIPDPNMIDQSGAENLSPVVLWQIDSETGNSEIIGEVNADFFGLPILSSDGTTIAYFERSDLNSFSLYFADANGENAQLAQPSAPTSTRWLNGLNSVIFQMNSRLWIQAVDGFAEVFPNEEEAESVINNIVSTNTGDIVYIRFLGDGNAVQSKELRLINIDSLGEESQLITTISSDLPIFDISLPND